MLEAQKIQKLILDLGLTASEKKALYSQISDFVYGLEFDLVVVTNTVCGSYRDLILLDVANHKAYNQKINASIIVQINTEDGEIM